MGGGIESLGEKREIRGCKPTCQEEHARAAALSRVYLLPLRDACVLTCINVASTTREYNDEMRSCVVKERTTVLVMQPL